jgi:hypothetical protein
MYVLYDYRYVIACSRLPYEFRREFRRLARGRVTSTYDWRTRAKDAVPAETQCRRVAEVLMGFEALRASGYALQTPWNFRSKHLQVLISRWSTQRLTSEEAAERLQHWCEFFRWIRKPQLIVLMNAPLTAAASRVGGKPVQYSDASVYSRPDIPVLTSEKAMDALTEHRGNLRKAARALGTTTHAVCEALNEGRQTAEQFPPGLTILT